MLLSKSSSGVGFAPENGDVALMNRTGTTLAVGSVVQLDFMASDADSTNAKVGDPNSIWANAILPTNTIQVSKVFAIVIESAVDNARVKCRVHGVVQARVSSAAAIGIGDAMLVPIAGSAILAADSQGATSTGGHLGFNLTALTASADQLVDVNFDGLHGAGRFSFGVSEQAQSKAWYNDIGSGPPATMTGIGTPITMDLETVGVSTVTDVVAAGQSMQQHATNTTAADASGLITSAAVVKGVVNPTLTWRMQTGASILNVCHWYTLTTVALIAKAVDTPTTELVAGFRYSTDVGATPTDTTGFWSAVTCDGTTLVVTPTPIAIAVSALYELKLMWDNTNSRISFYINGRLAHVATATLPDSATGMHIESVVIGKATAAKRMAIGSIKLVHA